MCNIDLAKVISDWVKDATIKTVAEPAVAAKRSFSHGGKTALSRPTLCP
jgi:hypothetical protein